MADEPDRRERVESEYGYLRGDPRGALEQVWGEINTALDLAMVPPGTATVLLEGLKLKCELGLQSPRGGRPDG